MLNRNTRVEPKNNIVFREEDDGAFLFNPDSGQIFYLNEIGGVIWQFCKKPITGDQIINIICSDYPDIPEEQISNDCLAFLDDLIKLDFFSPVRSKVKEIK